MRKFLFLIIAFLSFEIVQANKDYELFLKANQAAKSGHYQEALEHYKQIQDQSSGTLYNTAYVLYAQGKYTDALVALREAELLASGDLFRKIRKAIRVIHTKLELPQDGWLHSFFINMQQGVWLGTLQILFLLMLCLGVLMLANFFSKSSVFKKFFLPNKKIYVAIYIGLIVFFSSKIVAYYYVHKRCAIVLSDGVSVFAAPHTDAHVLGAITGGARVKLVDENDAWCKMQYLDSKGWVQKKDVRIL